MRLVLAFVFAAAVSICHADPGAASSSVRVGAAFATLEADDSMIIGGGISPQYVHGQERELRASAVVVGDRHQNRVAIVACDVIALTRDVIEPAIDEIEQKTGIPKNNILVNATHTHHAPTTVTVHGYEADKVFCDRVRHAIVRSVVDANAKLTDARFCFWLGEESSVGHNSRLLLADGSIFWVGGRDDAVRPTGPMDPELPVLAFRDPSNKLLAVIFNHSVHNIGAHGKVRSPSMYGLAAQELEDEYGGLFVFLNGASGSSHRMDLDLDEAIFRIKAAIRDALRQAQPHAVDRVAAIKRPFAWTVRTFDEAKQDAAVSAYCQKRVGDYGKTVIDVFRKQRQTLAPMQGQKRETWLQVMRIGDVAIAAVPGELFTSLGLQIKRRSPFRYTYIAELANDAVGYLPDREGFELGGYQTWAGLHCPAAPGTGEAMVDAIVGMLRELRTDEPR